MKNIPSRERAARRSRSSYSNPQRDGGAKVPFMYSHWTKADMHGGGNLPANILEELRLARWNPRAFQTPKNA